MPAFGFDSKTCAVISTIDRQSPDIAMGVDTGGAGDQGMMFGYATDETEELMPMPIMLAHRLTQRARRQRARTATSSGSAPTAKSQVTVVYEDNMPVAVDTVVVSTQHAAGRLATRRSARRSSPRSSSRSIPAGAARARRSSITSIRPDASSSADRRATRGSPAARSSSTRTAAWAGTAAARSAARIRRRSIARRATRRGGSRRTSSRRSWPGAARCSSPTPSASPSRCR